ncbi:hypothetical protein CEUSTIGMA_g7041.t1 [Chlamydomonas eustigma]|uniref:Rubisco LSMT substrate-binding domain-containing protein n=1 Tax=Chlamydomonas eustigma TaxID=1157962 RepID=A0A250XA15_9CHLO|nr:hypothetical protein CEUSTIGMA_g7041.t1 [Chlamydomonas eustigma]|eukprot:GAX79600.1 hypothetical protein CEUSTIGMA_g7041.t1 [Chlamydomonas eustigma]
MLHSSSISCSRLVRRGQHIKSSFNRLQRVVYAVKQAATSSPHVLTNWLQRNGGSEQLVEIKGVEMETGVTQPLDTLVARQKIAPGQVLIDIPEKLVITLDRVFESEFVAELLTNDKLSELACLTLYLMYEKKTGKESFWAPYIQALDRQRGRGVQAVESPLLWKDEELEELLQGSPVVTAVRQRLAGIREEYDELDKVWFMASSLFKRYPFDIPTEAFPFERFRQAFAAVQASIVHLQGVSVGKRFALVPLGPPLLSYSSTSKAMLQYNSEHETIQLVADREYEEGEALCAWCGPQPNSRLLLNYGLVDENNPYDKLQVTITLPNNDPLFRIKRAVLQPFGLATQQTFDLGRNKPLPPALLPFMRLALATTEEQARLVVFPEPPPPRSTSGGMPSTSTPSPPSESAGPTNPVSSASVKTPLSMEIETKALNLLAGYMHRRLNSYKHSLSKDLEIISDPLSTPRQRIAARLTKIEKSILQDCLGELKKAASGVAGQGMSTTVEASAAVSVELPSAEACEAALRGSSIKFA